MEKPGFSWSPEARVNKEPSREFPEISCQNPPLDHIRSLLPPQESLRRPFPFSADSSLSKTPLEAPQGSFSRPLTPEHFLDSPARSCTGSLWIPALVCSGAKVEPFYHQRSAVQPPKLCVAVPRGIQRIPSHWQPPFHFAAHPGTGLPLPNLFHLGALYWGVGEC